ncbi:hypothetical protein CSC2_14080 [Clostridium zeae]|uniref:SDR family NAD(P)-dependent oxidoreductase n=1 Tax=Clostridium zeae TaxID=2759022 RepID=A0ABQ1E7W7_9CLOT|nr:SDR family oxidoreductase [Clostridium zeae]GFZ30882.1 hypothetical protein CSC2_14080 [Clostridium zeae]
MNFLIICKLNELDYMICKSMAKNGYNVYFSYAAENSGYAEKLISDSTVEGNFHGKLIDVSRKESIIAMLEEFSTLKVSLDCFVTSINLCFSKSFEEISIEEMQLMINENINSMFYASKHALPMLMESKALYCNIIDSCAYNSVKGLTAYSMTQAASIGFMKSFSKEYARYGVRMINIVTDIISNNQLSSYLSNVEMKSLKKRKLSMKLSEISEICEEITNILCTSKHITGHSIFVDNLATDYIFC